MMEIQKILKDIWNMMKGLIYIYHWNLRIKERENGVEEIFKETLAENFSTLAKDFIAQSQEALQTVNMI